MGQSRDWDFEDDLFRLKDRLRQDDEFAQECYAALCNMQWQNIKDPGKVYGCSWRYAGGLIAEIRRCGENYLDWYCSGIDGGTPEGEVTSRVREAFKLLGWKELPYDD